MTSWVGVSVGLDAGSAVGDEGGEGQGGDVGMDGDGGESTSISSASSSISMSMDMACVVGGIPCPCDMGGRRGIGGSKLACEHNVVYNIWFYTYGLNVRQVVGFALACCASELGSLLCCQGLELELLVVAA